MKLHLNAQATGGRCVLRHVSHMLAAQSPAGRVSVTEDPFSQQGACNTELTRCRKAATKCLIPGLLIFILTMTPHERLPTFLLLEFLPGISICGFLMLVLATPIQWRWGRDIHARALKNLKLRQITMDSFISFNTSFCYIFSVILMLLAVGNTLALDGFTSAHLHSGDLTHANSFTPSINWVSLGNISIPFPSPPANVSLADFLKRVHSRENIEEGFVINDALSEDIPIWKSSLIDAVDTHGGGSESPHYFETAALLITVVLWGKTFELSAKRRTLSALHDLHRIKDTKATLVCAAVKERDIAHSSTCTLSDHDFCWVKSEDARLSSKLISANCHLRKVKKPALSNAEDEAWLDMEAAEMELVSMRPEKTLPASPTSHIWWLKVLQIPAPLLHLGDLVAVGEEERVPADGILICSGDAQLDESMISGESEPVNKRQGDQVLEGSVNCGQAFWMVVVGTGNGTLLGQIINTVRCASACDSPSGVIADKISGFFLPIALLLAISAWTVWGCLVASGRVAVPINSEHMLLVPSYFHFANRVMFVMKFGIAVLAIACPCALGLATPTAMAVATGQAVKLGILVKHGSALEKASKADVVVMDKTGTLTAGKPQLIDHLVDYQALSGLLGTGVRNARSPRHTEHCANGAKPNAAAELQAQQYLSSVMWLILSHLEQNSKHPIAQAIVAHARAILAEAGGAEGQYEVEEFESIGGRGISALLKDSNGRRLPERLTVGSRAFYETVAHDNNRGTVFTEVDATREWLKKDESSTIVVLFGPSGTFYAAFRFRDDVVAESYETVRYLRDELHMEIYMCTGDQATVAHRIAAAVGIYESHVVAEATPWAKAKFIESLRGQGRKVLMIGDGSNDSLALTNADVGVSIGANAEIMAIAADVVLIKHDLSAFLTFLKISRRTRSTIARNFAWAFLFNILGLPAAAGAFYPHVEISPLFAGTAMAMSSILVILNSLSLFRIKAVSLDNSEEIEKSNLATAHTQIEMAEDPRAPLVPRPRAVR